VTERSLLKKAVKEKLTCDLRGKNGLDRAMREDHAKSGRGFSGAGSFQEELSTQTEKKRREGQDQHG